jgi:F0F1-type ATP synthase assembly protein I
MTPAENSKKIRRIAQCWAIAIGVIVTCFSGVILGLVEDHVISKWWFVAIWPVVGLCALIAGRMKR